MKRFPPPLLLLVAVLGASSAQGEAPAPTRERINFDADWRFHLGDPDDARPGELDYNQTKDFMFASGNDLTHATPVARPATDPGGAVSFVQPACDDASWRHLNLPHDWAIEGPFDLQGVGETAKLTYWGAAWYRKHFTLPAGDSGRRIFLDIDGAMSYSTVWINGQLAGGWPYGYSSYELDLTPYLKFGADNVVSIRLDSPKDSSRWYPGAGLYRHVWLTKTSPVHLAHWGTYLTTPEVSPDSATLHLQGTLQNQSGVEAKTSVVTTVYDLDDQDQMSPHVVATLPAVECTVAAGQSGPFVTQGQLSHPRLWSTQNPQRYVAITEVAQNGQLVDRYETPFGIRTIQFDAAQGFLLNGQHVPINGVCNHHDLGALGTAFNRRAAERQLEILKEMGANAIRTSHNMPAPELLDLCDKMGFLVMDESFDCWQSAKKAGDYHTLFDDWHEKDLRAELRRDRNHPSVIIWSLGNEIREQGTVAAAPIAAELIAIARDEDPTRLASLGGNQVQLYKPGFLQPFALIGENYDPWMYAAFHQAHPDLPLFGSETSSTCSSRGVYFFPPAKTQENFQVNSYDTYWPKWASTVDEQFKALDQNPFVAGEFVWTGFDYLGEPTPYNGDLTNLLNFANQPEAQAKMAEELKQFGKIKSPARSSYFGIVDLSGFPKDRFYLYQARWRPDFPMVHLLPHWNWPGREGAVTPVYAYSSGDEVELFLNGQSLGRKKLKPLEYRFEWNDVTYAPGELKAVAYKKGKLWAKTTVPTTGPAAALHLQADRALIRADGTDLCFLTATVVDADGRVVPVAQDHLTFAVASGPGEIVATDNGDPTDLNVFSQPGRNAFNGRALLIVRGKAGVPGDIRLTVHASGLPAATCTVTTK